MSDEETGPALEAVKLRYAFKQHVAVNDLSFSVERRSIHGFVGPNGAGKTTTLKMIATLLRPQTGKILVFGRDATEETKRVRRRMGFMPDHFSMYPQMTVFEYLDFFAAAYGQDIDQRNRTIQDVLTLTDMDGRRDDLIKGLSRGMRQRVSLARVLVHDPDLLLLDEPASGLDPRARIELMEILRELARMGKTVLISSHILSELANLCDAVTIIDRGKTRYSGAMKDLLEQRVEGSETYELRIDEALDGFDEHIRNLEGVTEVSTPDGMSLFVITFDPQKTDAARVLRGALDAGDVRLAGYNRVRKHLDQAFMDLTQPGVRA